MDTGTQPRAATHCYYSPYGGAVRGVLVERDPKLDFEVFTGQLAYYHLAANSPLAIHVMAGQPPDAKPVTLTGWFVDPATGPYQRPGG